MPGAPVRSLALVRHPARDVSQVAERIEEAAGELGLELVDPHDADALVSLGGDGTMLAALRLAAPREAPVLGVALGSVGALTTVPADRVREGIEALASGGFDVLERPALSVAGLGEDAVLAFNDVVVVRTAGMQASLVIHVDGELYAAVAGDGVIVSTPSGSTGYAMAARGSILAAGVDALLITPLAAHGGSIPPLAVPSTAEIELTWLHATERARVEVDGQPARLDSRRLRVRGAPRGARIVDLGLEHPFAGLRRRGLVADSPRAVIVRDRSPR